MCKTCISYMHRIEQPLLGGICPGGGDSVFSRSENTALVSGWVQPPEAHNSAEHPAFLPSARGSGPHRLELLWDADLCEKSLCAPFCTASNPKLM